MIHFHNIRVKEVKKETADCVSISFEVPDALRETFAFTQGQSITIRKTLNNEEIRRSYSICSAPFEGELRVAVKQVENGRFSTFANQELKAGDELELMPPTGRFFTPLNPAQSKNYLAFAAGSGITPIISIIKTTLRTEPNSRFTLVYGNRSRASIIFFEELEALKNRYMDRLSLIYVLSREKTDAPLNFGRINTEKCQALGEKLLSPENMDEVFLCGPEEMIFSVKDWLLARGIAANKLHFELFSTPVQNTGAAKLETAVALAGPQCQVTIRLDGVTSGFELPFNTIGVLDAGLQHGLDLPFACKGAVCCTCRAKMMEGKVEMKMNYALSDEEIEQGYVLTCQSFPITDTIFVDFDQ